MNLTKLCAKESYRTQKHKKLHAITVLIYEYVVVLLTHYCAGKQKKKPAATRQIACHVF